MNFKRLLSAGMTLGLVVSTGCIYGSFNEPAEWSEARAKIGSMEAEFGTGNDVEQAALAYDFELRASVGVDLIQAAGNRTARLERNADSTSNVDSCSQFVPNWRSIGQRAQEYAGAGFDARLLNSTATTQLAVFVAASVLYGDIEARSDVIAPVLGADFDVAMAAAEQALNEMAQLVLAAETAEELLAEVTTQMAGDGKLIAHELTHTVQQGSRLRPLLSDAGQAALDALLAIAEAHKEVSDREPTLRTNFAILLGTLEEAAESLDACNGIGFDALQDAVRAVSVDLHVFASKLKTRHETAKNSINNVR